MSEEEAQDNQAVKADEQGAEAEAEAVAETPVASEGDEKPAFTPKQKPELDDGTKESLALRDEKRRKTPVFRRQEWFRYKKLGGKNAGWRRPRGIHSKMRRHYKYRPPVASIGYRGPADVRGLHPSGFEEVLVHRPEDLDEIDPKTQGARIGGTVGGKKQVAIVAKADELGIRVFNRGGN